MPPPTICITVVQSATGNGPRRRRPPLIGVVGVGVSPSFLRSLRSSSAMRLAFSSGVSSTAAAAWSLPASPVTCHVGGGGVDASSPASARVRAASASSARASAAASAASAASARATASAMRASARACTSATSASVRCLLSRPSRFAVACAIACASATRESASFSTSATCWSACASTSRTRASARVADAEARLAAAEARAEARVREVEAQADQHVAEVEKLADSRVAEAQAMAQATANRDGLESKQRTDALVAEVQARAEARIAEAVARAEAAEAALAAALARADEAEAHASERGAQLRGAMQEVERLRGELERLLNKPMVGGAGRSNFADFVGLKRELAEVKQTNEVLARQLGASRLPPAGGETAGARRPSDAASDSLPADATAAAVATLRGSLRMPGALAVPRSSLGSQPLSREGSRPGSFRKGRG
eukprot:Transcript_8325.p1 GENE.Transcript_8325~~Transcript_8325.p1  ORF type:complete len:427 (-),score=82.23 Transcript_8325:31-1311(-)